MKKIASILAFIAIGFSAGAQHTGYRFSNPPGNNSGTFESWLTLSPVDTAGATVDTVELRPHNAFTCVNYAVVDSSALRLKSLAGCWKGDVIRLFITNPTISNNFVYLSGNWVVSTGTAKISLTSAKKSFLEFVFDGSKFVERARNLNY